MKKEFKIYLIVKDKNLYSRFINFFSKIFEVKVNVTLLDEATLPEKIDNNSIIFAKTTDNIVKFLHTIKNQNQILVVGLGDNSNYAEELIYQEIIHDFLLIEEITLNNIKRVLRYKNLLSAKQINSKEKTLTNTDFKTFFDNLPINVYLKDENEKIIYHNNELKIEKKINYLHNIFEGKKKYRGNNNPANLGTQNSNRNNNENIFYKINNNWNLQNEYDYSFYKESKKLGLFFQANHLFELIKKFDNNLNTLNTLLQNIPLGVLIINSNGNIALINKECKKLFDITINNVKNINDLFNLLPGENNTNKFKKIIKSVFETLDKSYNQGFVPEIFDITTNSGRKKTLEIYYSVYKKSFCLIFRNVTNFINYKNSLEDANKALVKEYENMANIFENLPIGLALFTMDKKNVLYTNKKFNIITGWSYDEINNFKDFYNKILSGNSYKNELSQDKLNGIVTKENIKINRKNGEIAYVNLSNIFLKKQNLIIISIVDKTKGLIAQAEVKRFKSINDNAGYGTVIINFAGDILYINEFYAKICGYTCEELKNKNINMLFNINHKLDSLSILDYLKTHENVNAAEIDHKHKNKNIFPLLLNMTMFQDSPLNQSLIGITAIDIRDRKKQERIKEKLIAELEQMVKKEKSRRKEIKKAKKQLEKTNKNLEIALVKADEANKLKAEFLAMMSHELRTPLTGIIGFSQLLTLDLTLTEKQKLYTSNIFKSGNKLLDIISDIIELSVIETQAVKIDSSEFSLVELVDDIFTLLKEKINKKGLTFERNFNGVNIINSDSARLRQILFNLIGNAVKFTEKGIIILNVNRKANVLTFSVKDTGIGISKQNLNKIFDLFRQLENVNRRKFGGTGLGLTICKKLIEKLDGKIWVESEPGKGSEFFFSFSENKNAQRGAQKQEISHEPENGQTGVNL